MPSAAILRPASSVSPTSAPVEIRISSGDSAGLPQRVGAALEPGGRRQLAAVERGDLLARERERDRAVRPLERNLPRVCGLVRVGRAHEPEIRDRTQRGVRLDRLVRRPVLAQPDRVVRPGPDDGQAHQRGQAHRRPHVVAEDQEGRAVRLDTAAVHGDPVDDRAHRVLANAERDVAPGPAIREETAALELGLRRLDEIGGAADHRRHGVLERLHHLLPGVAGGDLLARLELGQRPRARSGRPTPRPSAPARPGTPATSWRRPAATATRARCRARPPFMCA